eukprot:TRINITY_DN9796_c0_g1_i5.p1 TRINITY_DN9796_c0_g1~~TRINITY_DN9796_c0_g1_i5.p1  ORF type:complete len:342 (+),score=65.79 TRINITY_DN9796_c0_g1_i5:77-1102(+)
MCIRDRRKHIPLSAQRAPNQLLQVLYLKSNRQLKSWGNIQSKDTNLLKLNYNLRRVIARNENLPSIISKKSSVDHVNRSWNSSLSKKASCRKLSPLVASKSKGSFIQSPKTSMQEQVLPETDNGFNLIKKDWVLLGDNKASYSGRKQFKIRTSLAVINKLRLLLQSKAPINRCKPQAIKLCELEKRPLNGDAITFSEIKKMLYMKFKRNNSEKPLQCTSEEQQSDSKAECKRASIGNTRVNTVRIKAKVKESLPRINASSKKLVNVKSEVRSRPLNLEERNIKKSQAAAMNSASSEKKCDSRNVRVVYNMVASVNRKYTESCSEESYELEDEILQPKLYKS